MNEFLRCAVLRGEVRQQRGRLKMRPVEHLDVRPLAGALGAEILGVDLAGELDDAAVAALRRIWLDYGVVFFRDQALSPERFLTVARRFGAPVEYPFVNGL